MISHQDNAMIYGTQQNFAAVIQYMIFVHICTRCKFNSKQSGTSVTKTWFEGLKDTVLCSHLCQQTHFQHFRKRHAATPKECSG